MAQYLPNPNLSVPERLILIEQVLFELSDYVKGNGQKGQIARLDERIDEVKEHFDGRMDRVEERTNNIDKRVIKWGGIGVGVWLVLQGLYYLSSIQAHAEQAFK